MKRSAHFPAFALILLITAAMGCGRPTHHTEADQTMSTDPMTHVEVVTTDSLNVYYPHYSRIDLVCGQMPSKDEQAVVFCAEAAFTHELLDTFSHSNIDGDHVGGGKRYQGARCSDNSGAFAWWPGGGHRFVKGDYDSLLDEAAAHGGMAFGQAIIISDGTLEQPLWRGGTNEYRALCEKDGRLCIIDSRQAVDYATFVGLLAGYGVTHALYLDMGAGWNHSWWRQDDGRVAEIHPRDKQSAYTTNWITFYQ